jgi:hypothetical protein
MSKVSATDLSRLLADDPAWRALAILAAEFQDLERRVAALERKRTDRPDASCPLCHGPMRMIAALPYPLFGAQGLQMHSFACTRCPNTELRRVDLRDR